MNAHSQFIYYFKGMCYFEGFGGYSAKVDDYIVQSGGNFLSYDEFIFKFTSSEEDYEDFNSCTGHVYISNLNVCIYRIRPCDECGANLTVIIDTDANAHEISWNVFQNNKVLMSGGPYSVSYGQYNNSECLPFGTYLYNIFDSYGDGLSVCFKDSSSSGYSVTINNSIIFSSDGSFTSKQSLIFGICTTDSHCDDGDACTKDMCDAVNRVCKFNLNCSKCNKEAATIVVNTDYYLNEFSWELSNAESDAIIASMELFQKGIYTL